jgi:hypothetical protein
MSEPDTDPGTRAMRKLTVLIWPVGILLVLATAALLKLFIDG